MEPDSNQAPYAAELRHLLEENAEVFILSIDAFKSAISALYSPDPEVAQYAMQVADDCVAKAGQLRRQTIGVLAQWTPTGEALRHVLSIERTAAESVAISQDSKQIAQHVLALRGAADQYFAVVHERASEVFLSLVQQVYFGLRGCLALTSMRDRALATRVVEEDVNVRHFQQMLIERIEQVSLAVPQHASGLSHLAAIVHACGQIGLSVLTISRDALAAPRHAGAPLLGR